jgi:O-glycosyl hydrolase
VTVRFDQTKQTMAGFGINNNWLPNAMTDQDADALFDSIKGLGMNILHIGMGANGGPMNSNGWSDINKAKARGAQFFIGTLWSPPAVTRPTATRTTADT